VKALVVPASSALVDSSVRSVVEACSCDLAELVCQTKLSDLVYLKCNIDKLQCGCIMAPINFRNRKVLSVLDVDVIAFYKHKA